MAIHEKSLIRPENISRHENLVIDGVDVSGDWSTFIKTRVVADYNEDLQDEIAAVPGGEYIHRCWQCSSCTNSCTVYELNNDFNPRHWIYLVRMGFEAELLRDKDIIWQCVSCHKCTNACPRDVVPEMVVKAIGQWMTHKGHTEKKPGKIFDEVFSEQVIKYGKIEDTAVLMGFLLRTKQSLTQSWLIQMIWNLISKLPVTMLAKMGFATVVHPRTKGWAKSRDAIEDFLEERNQELEAAIGPKQPLRETDKKAEPEQAQIAAE